MADGSPQIPEDLAQIAGLELVRDQAAVAQHEPDRLASLQADAPRPEREFDHLDVYRRARRFGGATRCRHDQRDGQREQHHSGKDRVATRGKL